MEALQSIGVNGTFLGLCSSKLLFVSAANFFMRRLSNFIDAIQTKLPCKQK